MYSQSTPKNLSMNIRDIESRWFFINILERSKNTLL